MRKDFGPQSWLYPMPVLIIGTYDENGCPDAMNAAWGGIHDTNQIGICLSAEHKTTQNIFKSGVFTVSIADASHIDEADFVGIVSANDGGDKMKKSGLHPVCAKNVNAPVFDEFPMALECRFVSYDDASGFLVGDIVNVCADEKILDKDGKISYEKLSPITFDPVCHDYVTLGKKAGNAFKDGLKLK